MTHTVCQWCGGSYQAKTQGGHLKKFCSTICRGRFWTAARIWVGKALETGNLTIEQIKTAARSEHARAGNGEEVA